VSRDSDAPRRGPPFSISGALETVPTTFDRQLIEVRGIRAAMPDAVYPAYDFLFPDGPLEPESPDS